MKKTNHTSYISPKLEFIALECNDLVTTSGEGSGGASGDTTVNNTVDGFTFDENILIKW